MDGATAGVNGSTTGGLCAASTAPRVDDRLLADDRRSPAPPEGRARVEEQDLRSGSPEVLDHVYRPLIDHLETECRRVLMAAASEAEAVRSKAEDEARRIVIDAHRERSVVLGRASSKQAHMYEEAEAEIHHWLDELEEERKAVLEAAHNEAARLLRAAANDAETRALARLQSAEVEAVRIVESARAEATQVLRAPTGSGEHQANGAAPEPTSSVVAVPLFETSEVPDTPPAANGLTASDALRVVPADGAPPRPDGRPEPDGSIAQASATTDLADLFPPEPSNPVHSASPTTDTTSVTRDEAATNGAILAGEESGSRRRRRQRRRLRWHRTT